MVSLLGSQGKYNGKRIRTEGFLLLEFEGNALYLHEEDYRYALHGNAYYLDLTKAQEQQFRSLNLKYVLLEGTVFSQDGGMYAGSITGVTRLQAWPPNGRR